MWLSHTLLVTFLALVLERVVGYPGWIYRAIGHPVEWFGSLIARLDRDLNDPDSSSATQRRNGLFALCLLLLTIGLLASAFTWFIRTLWYPVIIETLFAVPFLAQHTLKTYVKRVADGLETDLESGREAVGHIVGRDPADLDENGVIRAAIESLSENTSDGVIAPAFYLAIFGLPGIILYKVINTADSMIGYKSAKYINFGRATARLDDIVNWVPARLTGVLIASAASLTRPSRGASALEAMWLDARHHVSPNAGWPEAAMAGALQIALGGPRTYGNRVVDLHWMGNGRTSLEVNDIRKALRLYAEVATLTAVLVLFFWLFS